MALSDVETVSYRILKILFPTMQTVIVTVFPNIGAKYCSRKFTSFEFSLI